MTRERRPEGLLDGILGGAIRVFLVMLFSLGGAAAAAGLCPGHNVWPYGAACGLAVIVAVLVNESKIKGFCSRHAAPLILAAFTVYIAVLGAAAYSEIFSRGWFDRLYP